MQQRKRSESEKAFKSGAIKSGFVAGDLCPWCGEALEYKESPSDGYSCHRYPHNLSPKVVRKKGGAK